MCSYIRCELCRVVLSWVGLGLAHSHPLPHSLILYFNNYLPPFSLYLYSLLCLAKISQTKSRIFISWSIRSLWCFKFEVFILEHWISKHLLSCGILLCLMLAGSYWGEASLLLVSVSGFLFLWLIVNCVKLWNWGFEFVNWVLGCVFWRCWVWKFEAFFCVCEWDWRVAG